MQAFAAPSSPGFPEANRVLNRTWLSCVNTTEACHIFCGITTGETGMSKKGERSIFTGSFRYAIAPSAEFQGNLHAIFAQRVCQFPVYHGPGHDHASHTHSGSGLRL